MTRIAPKFYADFAVKAHALARAKHRAFIAPVLMAGMMVMFAPTASAQSSIETQIEIQTALELTKIRDLDFGQMVVPSAGRVQMTAVADPTCTPTNQIVHSGVCQSAAFEGRASVGQNITVVLPTNRRFELSGPGVELRVRGLAVGDTTGLQAQGRTNNVYRFQVTDANGEFNFHIGARVIFRNNQTPGIYDGTFNVSLDFQ